MGGTIIDVSSLLVFEGSGDSDDHKEDYYEDDDEGHLLVAICMNAAAVDDAESVLGFDDEGFILGFDDSDDGDEVRDSVDDRCGSKLGGFVGRDPMEEEEEEEEEEVNSGGVGRRRERKMEDMENKLFWETCLRQGYP